MSIFKKKQPRREFKLRKREIRETLEEKNADEETKRHVHFDPPDRSHYPRILDFWPVFLIVGVLVVFLFFVLRWISGLG
ncbi:hypothetical protein DRQ36_03120 [bacterium]|nr:MAG: hypothetical protein DRQ36_03120 [bacterium]